MHYHVAVFLQGLRVGGALSLSQARKVNVEPGCSVPDPCSSNPCPVNSYCSDDWDSYSCTCLSGQLSLCWFPLCIQLLPLCILIIILLSEQLIFLHSTLFYRLLWHKLHWCLLFKSMWAWVNMHQEAELISWLYLRLSQQLLWSLLREKVQFSTFGLNYVLFYPQFHH